MCAAMRRPNRIHKHEGDEVGGESEGGLMALGIHARLFDDDTMASFTNSSQALVPWNGDANLLIDRYDVRHLLQDLSGVRRRRPRTLSPDVTEEELNSERYRDLEASASFESEHEAAYTKEKPYYSHVPFAYGSDQIPNDEEVGVYVPPFEVPDHLHSCLPTTEKAHQIIMGTAKFVTEHGGQSEIILRVKQANNPNFGFLMSDHYIHPYFRYLVDHPGLTGAVVKGVQKTNVVQDQSSEGLSLLGKAYDDSDEDDEVPIQERLNGEMASCNHHNLLHAIYSGVSFPASGGVCMVDWPTDSSVSPCSLEMPVQSEPLESIALEPPPPGTEAETQGSPAGILGCKEPPPQLKLVIKKMVEFIARNGKEFEAVVRERDKAQRRFQFLLPWNEFHDYYLKTLEVTLKDKGDILSHTYEPKNALALKDANSKDVGTGVHLDSKKVSSGHQSCQNLLSGRSADMAVKVNYGVSLPGSASDGGEKANDQSANQHHKELSYDAAAAVVMAATRGLGKPEVVNNIERNKSSNSEGQGSGISLFLGRVDVLNSASSLSTEEVVAAGKVVAKAAAMAASYEADSADSRLTSEDKRKAERLKRAKMFAAMIKGGHVKPSPDGSSSHGMGCSARSSEVDNDHQTPSASVNEVNSDRRDSKNSTSHHRHHRHHKRSYNGVDDDHHRVRKRTSQYDTRQQEARDKDHKVREHDKERRGHSHSLGERRKHGASSVDPRAKVPSEGNRVVGTSEQRSDIPDDIRAKVRALLSRG